MLIIREFRKEDLPGIETLSPEMAEELRDFPDVLRETAAVCVDDADGADPTPVILGAAYLTAASGFLYPQYGSGRCFLKGNFQALPGSEQEIEASYLLLLSLQESLRDLQEKYPDRRLILQLFADAGKLAYTEFLMDLGFFPRGLMQAMELDPEASAEPETQAAEQEPGENKPENLSGLSEKFRLTRHTDPAEEAYFAKHFRLEKAVFGMPGSTEELRFLLRHGAAVWAVTEGEKLIASMTAVPSGRDSVSIERVFCRKAYRRRGITTAMMRAVMKTLAEEGFSRVRLTVFSDNLPAFSLYRKLGFALSENILEFHYETNPE